MERRKFFKRLFGGTAAAVVMPTAMAKAAENRDHFVCGELRIQDGSLTSRNVSNAADVQLKRGGCNFLTFRGPGGTKSHVPVWE